MNPIASKWGTSPCEGLVGVAVARVAPTAPLTAHAQGSNWPGRIEILPLGATGAPPLVAVVTDKE